MDWKDYRADEHFVMRDAPTDAKAAKEAGLDKQTAAREMEKNIARCAELQDALYADGREGIVIVLQAMDAAGKDSTIKHVMSGMNPQGVSVTSFKQPSKEELAHDYLWRAVRALPERGRIAIFNRSYYEDVLVVDVHDMYKGYRMASRCIDESEETFFKKRYRQINGFEEYLYENGFRVVKIFLNVSKETQKERFLARIDDETKNWKFSASDLKERAYWDEYMKTYQSVIRATSTKHSPWYVVPADKKWYARYLVSQILLDTLEACRPQYPELPRADRENLAACRASLEAEGGEGAKEES